MATTDLPCDGEGICMVCKAKPTESEFLICNLCATPWHVPCLSSPPATMSSAVTWECPDCCPPPTDASASAVAPPVGVGSELIVSIRAIEADGSLTEAEKARKRQELVGGVKNDGDDDDDAEEEKKGTKKLKNSMLDLIDEKFNCAFCMQLPERPVTTPCGHNFCLKCFQKWIAQGKNTCAKCRSPIPPKMASLPRINSTLVMAIRMAKVAKLATSCRTAEAYHYIRNENRPDKAFTTERAKKSGKANACSGQIFVTTPPDHFGPITAEYDPRRNQGVLVGETWEDRMECRQWGTHFPHVAGIAGQSEHGAQSVALSGGYEDDEDHGEWFLYTGSGGRDLSGNKRTNKEHSFDQKFEKLNKALRLSCVKGYPIRVVRSHKEKRSSYAPESGVRYDGVYRIEKCWRKAGKQGFKMCRYLFVRCDNEPAPWTSDDHGDRPRPLPVIKELKNATDITERTGSPAWDYNDNTGWKWMMPPPLSKKPISNLSTQDPEVRERARETIKQAHSTSIKKRLLKEFSCLICHEVMKLPLTTPCAHNFCKSCLLGSFTDLSFVKERTRGNGRTLRAQKIVNNCPCCPTEISEFLQNPQVNRDLMDLIESLQTVSKPDDAEEASDVPSDLTGKSNEANDDISNCNTCAKTDGVVEEKIATEHEVAKLDTMIRVENINISNGENSSMIQDNKLSSTTKDCAPALVAGKGEDGRTVGDFPSNEASPTANSRRKRVHGEMLNIKSAKESGKDGKKSNATKDKRAVTSDVSKEKMSEYESDAVDIVNSYGEEIKDMKSNGSEYYHIEKKKLKAVNSCPAARLTKKDLEASDITSSGKRKGTDDERVNAKKPKREGKNETLHNVTKDANEEVANESSVVHVSSPGNKCQKKNQDSIASPSPSGTPQSLSRREKINITNSPGVRTRSMDL